MKKYKNSIQIIGHIGNAPEIKTVSTGKLTKLSVAVNEYKRRRNGEVSKKTYWHQIVVWGKLAELVQKHVKKGSRVLVDGKITNRQYTDKNGKVKNMPQIVAKEIVLNYAA